MLIFAHRGASADAPENTLAAFELAIEQGVDGIELDVHLIEDELYVIHDRYLHRTTSGVGRVRNQTKASIQQLDAGGGQRVPSLWDALTCIKGACAVNIELKGLDNIIPLVKLLDQAVEKLGFDVSQFLISSFNHHLLFELNQLRPDLLIGGLTASCPLDYAAFADRLNAYSVHIDVDCVTPAFVADAHSRGKQVYVYTVDELEDLDELAAMGVNGVFSNRPKPALIRRAHYLQSAEPAPLAVEDYSPSAD